VLKHIILSESSKFGVKGRQPAETVKVLAVEYTQWIALFTRHNPVRMAALNCHCEGISPRQSS